MPRPYNSLGTAGGNDNEVQYNDGTGLSGIPNGDPGQVLVSNGPDAPPSFQTVDGVAPTSPLLPISVSPAPDGSNLVFTLSISPVLLLLFRNGQLLRSGAGNDYVLSGDQVTMAVAPGLGDWLFALGN
jgi:hypothetical protein